MLHQLFAVHEPGPHCLTLTEKLFGLIIPVAALLVIARAERHHRVRLGWIGHDHNLRGSLTAMADHFFSHSTETGCPHGRHSSVDHRSAAQRPRLSSTLASDAEVLAVRDVNGPKILL